jgi:hypothetical protein
MLHALEESARSSNRNAPPGYFTRLPEFAFDTARQRWQLGQRGNVREKLDLNRTVIPDIKKPGFHRALYLKRSVKLKSLTDPQK